MVGGAAWLRGPLTGWHRLLSLSKCQLHKITGLYSLLHYLLGNLAGPGHAFNHPPQGHPTVGTKNGNWRGHDAGALLLLILAGSLGPQGTQEDGNYYCILPMSGSGKCLDGLSSSVFQLAAAVSCNGSSRDGGALFLLVATS